MWHGGAQNIRKFRPGGDTTGDGYYVDPRTNNKVSLDSVRAMFFSTSMPVGLSYAQSTGILYYLDQRAKVGNLIDNSSENKLSAGKSVFKSVDDVISTIETLSEYNPWFKEAANHMRQLIAA